MLDKKSCFFYLPFVFLFLPSVFPCFSSFPSCFPMFPTYYTYWILELHIFRCLSDVCLHMHIYLNYYILLHHISICIYLYIYTPYNYTPKKGWLDTQNKRSCGLMPQVNLFWDMGSPFVCWWQSPQQFLESPMILFRKANERKGKEEIHTYIYILPKYVWHILRSTGSQPERNFHQILNQSYLNFKPTLNS